MVLPTNWMESANCRGADPELFFPERGFDLTQQVRSTFCSPCEVQVECLEYALEHETRTAGFHTYGIYGGVGPARRKMLKKHRLASARRS